MGNRLSKIYTRTGDKGTTGLGNGSRIDKDSLRIEAIGTVDELNSIIGMVIAYDIPEDIEIVLSNIQHNLFDLGGELSIPEYTSVTEIHVEGLETVLDELNQVLPPLKDFILPAGGYATATCHMARAVCRRAERRLVSLSKEETINAITISYLNRLSDLLFVIARILVRHENSSEVLWYPDKGLQE